jgi:hypothetical protein
MVSTKNAKGSGAAAMAVFCEHATDERKARLRYEGAQIDDLEATEAVEMMIGGTKVPCILR